MDQTHRANLDVPNTTEMRRPCGAQSCVGRGVAGVVLGPPWPSQSLTWQAWHNTRAAWAMGASWGSVPFSLSFLLLLVRHLLLLAWHLFLPSFFSCLAPFAADFGTRMHSRSKSTLTCSHEFVCWIIPAN